MKLPPDTIAKPSSDSLYPRIEELLETFVAFLEGIGGVENLMISNEMIMTDIEYAAERWQGFETDLVKEVSSRTERMLLLKRAKRVVLRRYFQEYVDAIAERKKEIDNLDDEERSELSDVETIEWDLANYLAAFVGRPASFPRDHAWLLAPGARFFGEPLSAHDLRHWSKQLLSAAGLISQAVVYFVSLDDQSKVKIGWTGNLPRKLTFFRNSTPTEPTIHLTLQGGYDLEQQLHRRFKTDWIVTEWFRFSDDIAEFIKESGKK